MTPTAPAGYRLLQVDPSRRAEFRAIDEMACAEAPDPATH